MDRIYLLFLFVFLSCKETTNTSKDKITVFADSLTQNIKKEETLKKYTADCTIVDSTKTQTSDYQGIKFYSENTLRGKGVVELTIDKNLEILNSDKTCFGTISLLNNDFGTTYKINFPKKMVTAREIIPDDEFQVFSFDSELPEINNEFLIIYINKEQKMIKKTDVKYKFLNWDDYVKSAYIRLYGKDKNLYKVIEIKNDSLKIKSISKSDCDYVESYKDVTKWIKWKDNNCKLIKFNFCY